MQATLSARPKTVLDIVPRPTHEPSARSSSSKPSKEDFASKLSDARSNRAQDASDKKPTAAAEESAAPKNTAKAEEPKKHVDHAKSRDDASEKSDESKPTDETAAKPTAEKKPEEEKSDDAATDAKDAQTADKPKIKDDDADAKKAAEAAAQLNAQLMPAAQAQAKEASADDESKKTDDATTAVAALAAQITTADNTQTDDDKAAADAATGDAQAAKAAATTDDGKPKAKAAATDTKAASVKAAPTETPVVPTHGPAHRDANAAADAKQDQNATQLASKDDGDDHKAAAGKKSAESSFDAMLAKLTPSDVEQPKAAPVATPQVTTPQPTLPPEARFAKDNVDNVVQSVHTQIAAGGNGQMKIRLDPPELGALEVAVKMVDGRMTASFTTSNDEATQLLSHSLNNLKSSLEATGISVDRIQVRQMAPSENAQQQPGSGEHKRENSSSAFDQPSQRGDQQRKEAVEKMWRKYAYGTDELDFVA